VRRKDPQAEEQWSLDRFGCINYRPEEPAAWLWRSAAGALPMLIRTKERMLLNRKLFPKEWHLEEQAKLNEIVADIEAARRLRNTRWIWMEQEDSAGRVSWTIGEDDAPVR